MSIRTIIILFCQIIVFKSFLFGQMKLKQGTIKVPVLLYEENGQRLVKEIRDSSGMSQFSFLSFITIDSMKIDDADLQMNFYLESPEKEFFHKLDLGIQNLKGEQLYNKSFDLNPPKDDIHRSGLNQRIWQNITEGTLNFGRQDTLVFVYQLWGDPGVNCNANYKFNFRKTLPHIGTGVGSFIFWRLGVWYSNRSDEQFGLYRDAWIRGDDETEMITDLLMKAEDYNKTASGLKTASLGLILADIGWYIFRSHQLKKKRYRQENYCPDESVSFEIKPSYQILPNTSLSFAGFSMTVNF